MDLFSVDYLKHLTDQYLVPFGINLLLAAVVFVAGRWLARALIRLLDRLMTRSKVDESLRKFLCDVAYAILLVIVVIAALERLGVKTTAAIAVLGAAGLAIGLALQGSLGNFASGVLIIVFKPYRVGDVITAAGHTGKVEVIKVFNTVMTTADNQEIIIPNGQITSGSITNITARGTRRLDLVVGIGYGDDIKKAKDLLVSIVGADERVLPDPETVIAVSELGESSVNLVVRPWCTTDDYWALKFDLTERIKLAFDEHGISIPFPQRDVHLHQVA